MYGYNKFAPFKTFVKIDKSVLEMGVFISSLKRTYQIFLKSFIFSKNLFVRFLKVGAHIYASGRIAGRIGSEYIIITGQDCI